MHISINYSLKYKPIPKFTLKKSNKMKIDIMSREFIKPSSPTPSYFKDFKFSYLDQLIPSSYVPLILYYSNNKTLKVSQSDISQGLKLSLSETLSQFYPLAGRMTKDQTCIDCNDQGVCYMESQVDCHLSEVIHSSKIELLDSFLPHKLGDIDFALVEEQLAIQVNMFQCGGIVIGICINHRVADICTLGTFIKNWASTARGNVNYLVTSPVYVSALLFSPVMVDSSPKSTTQSTSAKRIVTKRFVLTASAIATLKDKVVNSSSITTNPTRVEVVSAFIWKCSIEMKNELNKGGKTSVALQVVNLRGRMVPPLKEHSFGNIFQMASAITNGESTDLGCLVAEFRTAIGTLDSEYIGKLLGEKGFEIVKDKFVEIGKMMYKGDVELFTFSSWCRFENIYEADFGWGKPSWVSRGSSGSKNCVFLMDSTRDCGGIEAWVVMDEHDMAKFEQHPELQTLCSSQ